MGGPPPPPCEAGATADTAAPRHVRIQPDTLGAQEPAVSCVQLQVCTACDRSRVRLSPATEPALSHTHRDLSQWSLANVWEDLSAVMPTECDYMPKETRYPAPPVRVSDRDHWCDHAS